MTFLSIRQAVCSRLVLGCLALTSSPAALAGLWESINEGTSKAAEGIQQGLQDAHDANEAARAAHTHTVRGRVPLRDGRTLTCFQGIQAGYLGPPDLAAPGQATYDPKTGRATLQTAAIPAIVMTRNGTVISNDCDKLAAEGVLVAPPAGVTTGAAGSLPPKTACRNVPEKLRAQYLRCISFDPQDHCSALPADGGWLPGQSDLAAVCNSRKTNAVIAEEAEYQRRKAGGRPAAERAERGTSTERIQQDAKAKFADIQAKGTQPQAVAPAANPEDLAWDGAKLCQMKPAEVFRLREQALQFLRVDRKADRIVMSEVISGARQELSLDDKAFARRASESSQGLAAGGEKCARAFWDAEAIKAATAALSN